MYCGCGPGRGNQELRPYGPHGEDVCAGCVLDGPSERREDAQRALDALMQKAASRGKALLIGGAENAAPIEIELDPKRRS